MNFIRILYKTTLNLEMFTACCRSSFARISSAERIICSSYQFRLSAFSGVANNLGEFSVKEEDTSTNTTTPQIDAQSTRIRALSLYRQLLRGAERMPTPNRQNYVKRKTQAEYRKHMKLTDVEEIDFQLRLADTNLDTVLVQAEHLSRLFNDPEYQNYN